MPRNSGINPRGREADFRRVLVADCRWAPVVACPLAHAEVAPPARLANSGDQAPISEMEVEWNPCLSSWSAAPFGASAIEGYERAAHHFGLYTLHDPTFEGMDCYRLLVHDNFERLKSVGQQLSELEAPEENDDNLGGEIDILLPAGLHWFSHTVGHWDIAQDEGALECLGWSRTIVDEMTASGDQIFRVRLRLIQPTDDRLSGG